MKIRSAIALAALVTGLSASAATKDPLPMTVDAGWLAAHLADPDLVILHVGKKEEYDERHIPGARFVRQTDLAADRDGLTLQLPDPADLRQRLGALGIGSASRVVVYYGKDWVSPTTRVIYTFYAAGLGDHVALLDGGMDEWTRIGKAVTAAVPPAHPVAGPDIQLRPAIVDAGFVRAHAHAAGYALVDGRAPVYYEGVEASGAMHKERKGHIPGAVNIPYFSIVGADNKLKPRTELEAMFRAAGITPQTHVIAYCHIGQQATAVLFAARLAGIDAVLYDGSFEDWTLHDGPVEARAAQ
jgi:thiosulfate/3-mercaptopyruvate sulfurtransferase